MQKDKQKIKTKSNILAGVITKAKNNGITLIALIITIIVMLILVGVTVNLALKGGLFNTAQLAKTNTQKEMDKEQLQASAWGATNAQTGEVDFERLQEDLVDGWTVDASTGECTSPHGNTFTVGSYGTIKELKWKENENGSITDGNVTLQTGDYVNYEEIVKKNPVTLTSESKVIKDLQTYSGYTGTDYNTIYSITQETDLKWRVLDVKDGNLRLISEKPTNSEVFLRAYNGYNNAVYLIDEVCDILYSTDKGTVQNLKIEDIQDKTTYEYTQYENSEVDTGKYGGVKEYTSELYRKYPEIFAKERMGCVDDKQGTEYDISEQKEPIKQTEEKKAESKIKITQTYWEKNMTISDWGDKPIYDELFMRDSNGTNYIKYWLSSRCVDAEISFASFYVYAVNGCNVSPYRLFYSVGNIGSRSYSLRPVVTLKSGIQLTKDSNGIWEIN